MKYNKHKLFILEFLLTIILFITLIVSNKVSNIALALLLLVVSIFVKFNFKKKKILSINKKEVNILLIVSALLYLGLFYLLGLWVSGFTEASIKFSFKTLYQFILPLIVIIISSEYIRITFLSQEGKIRVFKKDFHFSKFFTFLNLVLIDLIVFTRVYNLSNLNDLLVIVGFVLFSSISCNLFFNYISERYGIEGIIGYRIITTIYTYIIPYIPDVYIFFRTVVRMLYPYILYILLENTYAKNNYVSSYRERRQTKISAFVIVIVMIFIMMLVSCQFKFGVLVIGSNSMEGTINMGDAVVFEQYKKQQIKEGQVIIFSKAELEIVHRVVDVKKVNGVYRYYTKGDSNPKMDSDYITGKDIKGIVKFKISYIGYPTIWLRNLFV